MSALPRFDSVELGAGAVPASAAEDFARLAAEAGTGEQWVTPEQIPVGTLYGEEAYEGADWLDTYAGLPPFTHGPYATMYAFHKAVEAGLIDGDPVMFATNHLVLITPADNPGGITGLDGSLEGRKLVICAPEVPCGAATVTVARKAGIILHPASEETKVTDVLGKVSSGEADAGLVYATDATSAKDAVMTFEIPGAEEEPNTYWIAKVKGAKDAAGADAFIARITGEGAAVLAGYGFGPAR